MRFKFVCDYKQTTTLRETNASRDRLLYQIIIFDFFLIKTAPTTKGDNYGMTCVKAQECRRTKLFIESSLAKFCF
jgi:hypothetical protein